MAVYGCRRSLSRTFVRRASARDRRKHLLDPVGGVIVEDLAGAQTPQLVVIARAGHAQRAGPHGRRHLSCRLATTHFE